VTHPFHPWVGREFVFVAARQTWGKNRVFFFDEDGVQRSLPRGVHLSDPIRCSTGQRIYSRIDLTEFSNAHRIISRAHWSYKCHASTSTQGGGAGAASAHVIGI
jgi:Family of unknown function (DUF5372)